MASLPHALQLALLAGQSTPLAKWVSHPHWWQQLVVRLEVTFPVSWMLCIEVAFDHLIRLTVYFDFAQPCDAHYGLIQKPQILGGHCKSKCSCV